VSLSGRVQEPRALQSVLALQTCEAPAYLMRHGPLQAWLEVTLPITTVRVRLRGRNRRRHSLALSAPHANNEDDPRLARSEQARLLPYKPDRGARPDLDRSYRRPHAHANYVKTKPPTELLCA
jgi:hypothetical protein